VNRFEQSLGCFLERSDNVIARCTRCLRDFSAFFYFISDSQKWGIYVTSSLCEGGYI